MKTVIILAGGYNPQTHHMIRGQHFEAMGDEAIFINIASHGMMIAANHNFSDPEKPIYGQGLTHAPIVIKDDVWIGGRVNITAGVTIGHGAVIGGGSVVTKDIPAMSIAVGVPAKVIRMRNLQAQVSEST